MRIDKTRLNPLFEQYSNQENRLTHALLHTVGSSESLFSKFLKDIVGVKKVPKKETYEISSQKAPLSLGDDKVQQVESVPDAWIVDSSSKMGIAVEVKDKKNALRLSQLRGHANRISDYRERYLLSITPDIQEPEKIRELERKAGKNLGVVWRSWGEVYRWLGGKAIQGLSTSEKDAFLAGSMREYLERRGEVLGFQGIKFANGFDVRDAKVILNAEMEELQKTVDRVYRNLPRRRPAITTFSKKGVWDCFGDERGFTSDLHLTLGIEENWHDICLTIPNAAGTAWPRLKAVLSRGDAETELLSRMAKLRKKVPHLYAVFYQRHFVAQRFGTEDGFMEFSLDTVGSPFRSKKSRTREMRVWWPAFKNAVSEKKGINAEVQFIARFFYRETKGIDRPQFIETAKDTVQSFNPLYDFLKAR
jgi:hypothetical protein